MSNTTNADGNAVLARRPELVALSEIEQAPAQWLWEPYLPLGMLTMLSGEPGCGTTYLALAIAAEATRKVSKVKVSEVSDVSEVSKTKGEVSRSKVSDVSEAPEVGPGNVLYVSVENSPAAVLCARFAALGGAANRFMLLRETVEGEGDGAARVPFRLTDIDVLEEAVQRTSARLLIVDPIQSYLGAKAKERKGRSWPLLEGLTRLAEKYQCCVLLIRHCTRARSGKLGARGVGMLDWTGAVRSELVAGAAGDDPQQRALVHVRSSVGALGPAVGYAIDGDGKFHWTGETDLTAESLLGRAETEFPGAMEEAEDFLRGTLAKGPKYAMDVFIEADRLRIAEKTLKRAKARMEIISEKDDGILGRWIWSLPKKKDKK